MKTTPNLFSSLSMYSLSTISSINANTRYGCNNVTPRKFEEIDAIYSDKMSKVFKGGLIYEYSEEPNNYGLVRIMPNGSIQLLSDFHQARERLNAIASSISTRPVIEASEGNERKCMNSYRNLFTTNNLPPCVAPDLVHKGVKINRGKFIELTDAMLESPYEIFDVGGNLFYLELPKVVLNRESFASPYTISGMYKTSSSPIRYGMSDEEFGGESDEETNYDESDSSSDSGSDTDQIGPGRLLCPAPLAHYQQEATLVGRVIEEIYNLWAKTTAKIYGTLGYETGKYS